MSTTTGLRKIADRLTGGIEQYIRTRRAAGKSWRNIQDDVLTEHNLDIAYETLRRWSDEGNATDDRRAS